MTSQGNVAGPALAGCCASSSSPRTPAPTTPTDHSRWRSRCSGSFGLGNVTRRNSITRPDNLHAVFNNKENHALSRSPRVRAWRPIRIGCVCDTVGLVWKAGTNIRNKTIRTNLLPPGKALDMPSSGVPFHRAACPRALASQAAPRHPRADAQCH
jgi:hypothetical protein